MSDKNIQAFEILMGPVIKMLLSHGVTYREFMQLCKTLYVEVASDDYGIDGRPTNISRMALLTGMDRKEVKRVKDKLTSAKEDDSNNHLNRISRVLSAWSLDEEFSETESDTRKPKALPFKGEVASFERLTKRYGGDIPPGAFLKELVRVEAVEIDADEFIQPIGRAYIPRANAREALDRAGQVMHDFGMTLHNNLYVAREGEAKRFERRATNLNVSTKALSEFRKFLDKEGQTFLERADAWLTEHEVEDNNQNTSESARLGVGLYWIGEAAK